MLRKKKNGELSDEDLEKASGGIIDVTIGIVGLSVIYLTLSAEPVDNYIRKKIKNC